MKEGFRQCMAWLHTWTGLILGWVLYFIFVTGTAGYFDTEIDRWMQPELPLVAAKSKAAESVAVGRAYLERNAPRAERWYISPPTSRDTPNLYVYWTGQPTEGGRYEATANKRLDTATGEPLAARKTGGGQLLYRMHYELHYLPDRWAVLFIGVCTMLMLVAIISGIVTHKKIFKDFFTFRPAKGQRSWLDAHNLISVAALPFFIMITYTGLLFFIEEYMPSGIRTAYGEGRPAAATFYDEVYGRTDSRATGVGAPLAPLGPMVALATERWGEGGISSIDVDFPGDAAARVQIFKEGDSPLRGGEDLVFDGVSGNLVSESPAITSTPKAIFEVLLGLHEGAFAGTALRWLYFASGLLGSAMIATGLVLWTVKRRPKHLKTGGPDFGHRLVERLNVGIIAGLPAAIAVYFWANRLIPADLPSRESWEAHAMFLSLATLLVFPVFRPVMRAWVESLWVAAALYLLLPVVNALTTQRHLGVTVSHGAWDLAGVDLTAIALGVCFAVAALKVRRHASSDAAKTPRRTRRASVAPAQEAEAT
jgi:uncharacterized iron-regulated membrane protein